MSVRAVIGPVGSGKTMRLAEIGLDHMLNVRGLPWYHWYGGVRKLPDRVYANFHYGERIGAGLLPCKADHGAERCSGIPDDRTHAPFLRRMSKGQARKMGLRWETAFSPRTDLYTYYKDMSELADISRARNAWNNPVKQGVVILIDEINVLAPSRMWQAMDPMMMFKWSHNRKQGLDIWWSAQREARADKVVRELTEVAYNSFGFGPKLRPWFYWRREYVPKPDDADPTAAEVQLAGSFWHSSFSRHKSSVYNRYDTYEEIMPAVNLLEAQAEKVARRKRVTSIA